MLFASARAVLGIAALSAAASASGGELTIPYEKYELDNGLDVILAQDRSTPIVAVNVWYHVGSKDEVEGRSGFAHLFEHLMFQGSASSPGDYFDELEKRGAQVNGTTSYERTNYFEIVPSQFLPTALFLESDRMVALNIDQDLLDNQREVVRNERRQRVENRPYGGIWGDMYAAMYPPGHPYHITTIGKHEDLVAANLDDVVAFYDQYYVPNNASLVVCGDFDIETAKGLIEEYFGDIERGEDPSHATAEPVELAETLNIRQYQAVPKQKVWMSWHGPKQHAAGNGELSLVASALSDGEDSRLKERLVRELGVAESVYSWYSEASLGSMFWVLGTPAEGHTSDEFVAEVDKVINELLTERPVTADELERIKASWEAGFYGDLAKIGRKADILNAYNWLEGEPDWVEEDRNRYLSSTADGLATAAQSVLSKPRVEIHIWPNEDKVELVVETEPGKKKASKKKAKKERKRKERIDEIGVEPTSTARPAHNDGEAQ